jgi:hypothetical protein
LIPAWDDALTVFVAKRGKQQRRVLVVIDKENPARLAEYHGERSYGGGGPGLGAG